MKWVEKCPIAWPQKFWQAQATESQTNDEICDHWEVNQNGYGSVYNMLTTMYYHNFL